MRTINQTIGADNTIIWLVRMTDGTNTYRLSTSDITLSGNAWDGKALGTVESRFSLNEIGKRINVPEGGTTGEISTVTFTISNKILNSLLDGFFNEFYPATSGKQLIGNFIEVGIIWQGATTESQITWLHQYNVDDYSWDVSNIGLICSEFSEFENFMIPYYKVQDELDNGVSYFPQAPEDNKGLSLPIIYGSFNRGLTEYETGNFILAPSILVNKYNLTIVIATHQVKTTSINLSVAGEYNIHKYIGGVGTYLTCYKLSDTFGSNLPHKYWIQMTYSVATELLGSIAIPLIEVAQSSSLIEIENISDNDPATYDDLDANGAGDEMIAMRTGLSLSTSELGYPSTVLEDVYVRFRVSSSSAGARNLTVNYYNPTLSLPASGAGTNGTVTGTTSILKFHQFGNSVIAKRDAIVPWTFEELMDLDYRFINTETSGGNIIRIYNAFLICTNIKVTGLTRRLETNLPRNW